MKIIELVKERFPEASFEEYPGETQQRINFFCDLGSEDVWSIYQEILNFFDELGLERGRPGTRRKLGNKIFCSYFYVEDKV